MILNLLLLWVGGCLATLPMAFGARIATDGDPDIYDVIAVMLWPVVVTAFVIDVARGWRP